LERPLGEIRGRSTQNFVLHLEQSDTFLRGTQLVGVFLRDARFDPVFDIRTVQPVMEASIGDSEVFRDLRSRGFVASSDRDNVTAELSRIGLRPGSYPSSENQQIFRG
jgi:hypothetical protein